MASPLNPKQQRFSEEYLVDLNATQAAIRAGYSKRTAGSIGHDLLKKPEVQTAITDGRSRISQRTEINQDRVVKEMARLAFLDIRKIFDAEGHLLSPHGIDDETIAAIAGIEVEAIFEGVGKDREQIGNLHKIKLADKNRALENLARVLGMFKDSLALTGAQGKELYPESTKTVEEASRAYQNALKES